MKERSEYTARAKSFYTTDGCLAFLCRLVGCKVEGKDIEVSMVDGSRKVVRTMEVKTSKKDVIRALGLDDWDEK